MNQAIVCYQCLVNHGMPPKGTLVDINPPFAITVVEGEARCVDHLPDSITT